MVSTPVHTCAASCPTFNGNGFAALTSLLHAARILPTRTCLWRLGDGRQRGSVRSSASCTRLGLRRPLAGFQRLRFQTLGVSPFHVLPGRARACPPRTGTFLQEVAEVRAPSAHGVAFVSREGVRPSRAWELGWPGPGPQRAGPSPPRRPASPAPPPPGNVHKPGVTKKSQKALDERPKSAAREQQGQWRQVHSSYNQE